MTRIEKHDPYAMRSFEQILSLFDGGDFLAELLSGHRQLQQDLLDHAAVHGTKGCKGVLTLQIGYQLGKSHDVAMSATVTFTPPKKPASSAAAYLDESGELTLYSPMLRRMHEPVRDATDYDPETGEVRDA